jgi:hypothetical protein
MSDDSSQQAVPDEGAASPRLPDFTPVNIVVTVDSPNHVFYKRPSVPATIIANSDAGTPVLSVTVIDTASGLTSTWRAS